MPNNNGLVGKRIPLTEYEITNPHLKGRRVEIYTPGAVDASGNPIPGVPAVKLTFKGGRLLTQDPITIHNADIAMQRHMNYVTRNGVVGRTSLIEKHSLEQVKARDAKARESSIDKFLDGKSDAEMKAIMDKIKANLKKAEKSTEKTVE